MDPSSRVARRVRRAEGRGRLGEPFADRTLWLHSARDPQAGTGIFLGAQLLSLTPGRERPHKASTSVSVRYWLRVAWAAMLGPPQTSIRAHSALPSLRGDTGRFEGMHADRLSACCPWQVVRGHSSLDGLRTEPCRADAFHPKAIVATLRVDDRWRFEAQRRQ